MSRSILQNEKVCYVCGTPLNLHKHHVFGGPNRPLSEKWGLWLYLCGRHHNLSKEGVHFNKDLDNGLKKYAQDVFMAKCGTEDDFRAIFGKLYVV